MEQACDPSNWRWKCWDVRSDGMVFWSMRKGHKNNQYWITWDRAIEFRRINRECTKNHRIKNIDKIKLNLNKWRAENKKRISQYERDRRNFDPIHAMSCRVRDRIKGCLKRKSIKKTLKTQDMLGCDWAQLKAHLESKFVSGMSWGNRRLWTTTFGTRPTNLHRWKVPARDPTVSAVAVKGTSRAH